MIFSRERLEFPSQKHATEVTSAKVDKEERKKGKKKRNKKRQKTLFTCLSGSLPFNFLTL